MGRESQIRRFYYPYQYDVNGKRTLNCFEANACMEFAIYCVL